MAATQPQDGATCEDDEVRLGLPGLVQPLRRYGLKLTRDRDMADELVQATCLQALERSDQFPAGTRLDRWAISVFTSIWFNELRRRRSRDSEHRSAASDCWKIDGEKRAVESLRANEVLTGISKLPASQSTAITLVCVKGPAYRQAANALDIPIGTVMSRLAAARASLAHLNSTA